MGKHTRYHGFVPREIHEQGEDTSLAAVLLEGGIFERVEAHTAVDEVIAQEPLEVTPEEAAMVLIPADDYEWLMANANQSRRFLNASDHQPLAAGTFVLTAAELQAEIAKKRLHTLMAFLRYVWFNAGNLWAAMRNLLAITHRHRPDFIKGMSGEEIGRMLAYKGRAGFNAHEIRLVVDYLKRWGVAAAYGVGGKGEAHAATKSAQMKGRRHRAQDYQPDPEPLPRSLSRRQLDALHDEAEQRRLAEVKIV